MDDPIPIIPHDCCCDYLAEPLGRSGRAIAYFRHQMTEQNLYAMIRELEQNIKNQSQLDRQYYANIESKVSKLEERIRDLERMNVVAKEWGII